MILSFPAGSFGPTTGCFCTGLLDVVFTGAVATGFVMLGLIMVGLVSAAFVAIGLAAIDFAAGACILVGVAANLAAGLTKPIGLAMGLVLDASLVVGTD